MQNSFDLTTDTETIPDCRNLPAGWQPVQFGKIVEFKNGLNYSGNAVGQGLKIIGVSDFQSRITPDYNNLQELSGFNDIDSSYLLKDGDLIFVRSNGNKALVGRALLIKNLNERVTHSGFTIRARLVTQNVLPSYLALTTTAPVFKEQIHKQGSGTNISNLSQSVLGCVELLLPPLDEQARIVEILDAADAAVAAAESLIAAKSRYKAAVAERLLTGRVRFPEFDEPWREYHLGELFTERIETNRPDLKLLAVTGNDGIVDRDRLVKRDTSSEDKSPYLRVAPGDIAYNTMRMWQGVFGLSTLEGIVSPAYTVCVPHENIVGTFAAFLFKTPASIGLFRRYSQGLVSDTLSCKFPAFAKIMMMIPTVPEQKRIADALTLMDDEIKLLQRQRDLLKTQKQGLMQKLLTGEIRVREEARP